MKIKIFDSFIMVLAIVLMIGGIQAQKHKGSKGTSTTVAPEKTPYIPIPFINTPSESSDLHSHQLGPGGSLVLVDRLTQQNSSLPFSVRFPKPQRISSKFHYPMLPNLYWNLHKRPEVPLVEPDQELDYGDI